MVSLLIMQFFLGTCYILHLSQPNIITSTSSGKTTKLGIEQKIKALILYVVLQNSVALGPLFSNVFIAVTYATHTKSFKIKNMNFITISTVSNYMFVFNIFIAQNVSPHLTILKHIKMSGKFSVITLVNVFLIL
jgi:hypothetical protein